MVPPEWLIEGCVPRDALVCTYGPPGVGKSFVALDQVLCIATGNPWMGREVKQGPVLYIAAEGVRGLGKRMSAWREFHGLERSPNFRCVDQAIQLMDTGQIGELEQHIQSWDRPPLMIVIDTFSRCLVGGNENLQQDVGEAVAAMNRIQRCCSCTVNVLHHTGWNGDHERGSTVLPGALDASMHLSPEKNGKSLILKCKKQKDWEAFGDMGIQLLPFSGSLVPIPVDVDRLAFIDPIHWLMLSNLEVHMAGEGSGFDFLQRSSGETETTFKRVFKKFAEAEAVQKGEGKRGGWFITPKGKDLLELYRKRMWTDEELE